MQENEFTAKRSERDIIFEQKLHRDLMLAQSSFEQAMARVKQ